MTIFAGLDSDCANCVGGAEYPNFCATCILVDYAKCVRCDAIVPTASGRLDCGDFFCIDCEGAICSACGNYSASLAEIDGDFFCQSCYTTCPDCGALHRYADSRCERCEACSEEVFCCERCDDCAHADDVITVHIGYRREERWCSDCAGDQATQCADCGDYWADDSGGIYTDSRYAAYCPRCMEERALCDGCGRCLPYAELYYRESMEENYCSACDPGDDDEKPNTLHSYVWNPASFIFHGEGQAFAGVELEVEGNDGQGEVCDIMEEIDGRERYFYLKEDSSLGSAGVEIVGMPMTWGLAQENWEKVLCAVKGKAKSHDTTTCGLHVHVTRSAYSVDTWERVCLFVDLHWPRFVQLARRESEHYAKKLRSENPCHCMQQGAGRYWALNFENESTVEWRLWRGTLKAETFFACVGCSLALPEYIAQADDCYGWLGFMAYCADNNYQYVSNYFNK